MGLPLAQAKGWLAKRNEDIPQADQEFIASSDAEMRRKTLRALGLAGVLIAGIVAVVAAWQYEKSSRAFDWSIDVTARPLTGEQDRSLKPNGLPFKECTSCPEMVFVPAGEFMMGSPPRPGINNEVPLHRVTIAKPFAVARFELTFDEWDACADRGECYRSVRVNSSGRSGPAIHVCLEDAQRYVKWLSRTTGKSYRLLSEAEWEYAARGEPQRSILSEMIKRR